MHLLHAASLLVIAFTWLLAWRVGCRWCRCCGVNERVSLWALGCVLPTAGLIFAVHLLAFVALFSGRGVVTPEPVAFAFLVLTCVAHRLLPDAPSSGLDTAQESVSMSPGLGFWRIPALIVIGMYGVFLLDATARYPTGYDALSYHLSVAVGWMQWQSLELIAGSTHWSFPENGMIVPFLLSFARFECPIPLVHVPKGLLVAAVTFGLGRALGVSRLAAWCGVLVVASVPIVVFQSFSGYIDLYAAASWLSAVLALTWAARAQDWGQRRGLLVIAGLSAGIALGSKTTFLVTVPLLALIAGGIDWIRPRSGVTDRARPVHSLAAFALAALVCSTFWFVRSAVRTGNPIYPLGVKIAGRSILPGFTSDDFFPERTLAQKLRRWCDYPWRETKYSGKGYPYSVNNGVGAAYAAFVPLGLLAAAVSLGVRRPRAPTEKWRLILLVLCLTGAVLLLTAFCEMLRFVLPQMLLAVPVAMVLIDRLIAKFPRSMLAMVTVALMATATVAAYRPAQSFASRVRNDVWARSTFYGIPPLIDELADSSRVLNLSDSILNYPLRGSRLGNVVIDPLIWSWLLDGQTISAQALRRNRIDYIYVRQPWPDDWPDDLPVELIYDDSGRPAYTGIPPARVYRIIRNSADIPRSSHDGC